MRTCSNCGAPLEDGAQFCTECGTKVTSSQKICPHCGAVTDDDSLFCSECGAQLEVVQQFTPEQPVVEPLSNMKTNTRSSSDNIIPSAKKESNTMLYVVGIIMAVILLAFGGNFAYKHYMDKQDDSYDTNQYNQESSSSNDNTDNLVFDYEAEEKSAEGDDSVEDVVEKTDVSQYGPELIVNIGNYGFKMIRVEGGTFSMGATSEQESDALANEKPVHNVSLSTYMIGETEVTQGLWFAVMGSIPHSQKRDANLPIVCVSWFDCQKFLSKINEISGYSFRLPTEAEWEFAARGGNKSIGNKYSGSNSISDVAWYKGNSDDCVHQAKSKSPNELGLYDMSGNVWELCQDYLGTYSNGKQDNPINDSEGDERAARGGSCHEGSNSCRISYRSSESEGTWGEYIGFRLAL